MSESSLEPDNHQTQSGLAIPGLSGAVPTSTEARAKRRIAALEEELQMMRQERGMKKRFVAHHHYQCLFLIDPHKKNNLLCRSRQGDSPDGRSLY
jgi:hypothetical protein